ncbi:MAG: carbon-nitrogen hydrolase family protein [Telmatospirillum sp.]|nr:carbon-nitrogen hydrolase family protein [Telmatospirillum sp.]
MKVACIQVNATNDLESNIRTAAGLVCDARAAGAQMAFLPENVAMMEFGGRNIVAKAMPEAEHKGLAAFRELAAETRLWLHCGSLAVLLEDGSVANRTYFLDPRGDVVASYDKIHMFDVDLDGGESYRESSTFHPGRTAVVTGTPWGRLGLSICYDLRFPHLYRSLAKAGADFLAVPAAFTRTTGRAHWHVLLRARAIETGCFVFAPAQCGDHVGGRQTFGHSLIVSPWGVVLADGGEQPGFVMAEIDPAEVAAARGKIPALAHDRAFDLP